MKKFILILLVILCVSCLNDDERTYVIESIELVEHKTSSSTTLFLNIPSHQEYWIYIYHVTKQGHKFDLKVTLLEPNHFCPSDTIIYIDAYNIKKKT